MISFDVDAVVVNDLTDEREEAVGPAKTCFLKSESTLVCLCSRGSPKNLLRVFCRSVGSALLSFFFVVLLLMLLRALEEVELHALLLMRAHTPNKDAALLPAADVVRMVTVVVLVLLIRLE